MHKIMDLIRGRGVNFVVLHNRLGLNNFIITCIAQQAVSGYYSISVAGRFYHSFAIIFPQITLLVVTTNSVYVALLCILK